MVDILFKFKKPINWGSEKFGMTESISNIFILFLRSNSNVVLVTFSVVVITSDWSIESFLLPFKNMLERDFDMPRGV
jgi:hypothetical protein